MQKEAFEPTGLIPRSIIRTFDRFLQQLLPGSESVAIQEYRISRYQILVSIQSLCVLIFIPFFVNCAIKSFVFKPLTEHFWNSQQKEIFLNAYQEKRAFAEMQDFSEKIFFESLLRDTQTKPPQYDMIEQILFTPPQIQEVSDAQLSFPHKRDMVEGNCGVSWKNFSFLWVQPEKLFSTCENTFLKSKVANRDMLKLEKSKNFADVQQKSISFQAVNKEGKTNNEKEKKLANKLFYFDTATSDSDVNMFVPTSFLFKNQAIKTNSVVDKGQELAISRPVAKHFSQTVLQEEHSLQKMFQLKSLQIAERYNQQSISAITNVCADLCSLFTLYLLSVLMRAQIIILKSFLIESVYSLSDTTKSFFLILIMDLLVGFHSPRAWEVGLESLLQHFGLPESENFILLFVALFPVFLDTVFKYWIFRYLNKISPSTVVTYHSMLE